MKFLARITLWALLATVLMTGSGFILGPQNYSSEHLYGVWHGETTMQGAEGSALRQWDVTLTQDNRFLVEFTVYQDNRLLDKSTHRGTFRVERNIMVTDTEVIITANGEQQMAPGELVLSYEILELDDEVMVYRSLENNVTYLSRRGPRP